MAIDMGDEILQDFLVEAGEILEQLNEQLLELEQTPDDYDLLNAVFRGFHTIKGGAGFLSIEALVEVCHRSEDVFNILRQGQRQVDAELMDVMLTVLDVVNGMFGLVREGQEPEHADPKLIQTLNRFAVPATEAAAEAPEQMVPEQGISAAIEVEADRSQAPAGTAENSSGEGDSEEISEAEFEALLDELHGKGKHGGIPGQPASAESEQNSAATPSPDEITEAEFEALLDELHGVGKHSGVPSAKVLQNGAAAGANEVKKPRPKRKAVPKAKPQPKQQAAVTEVAQQKQAGESKSVEIKPAAEPAQAALKANAKISPQPETTVRVDTARLDDIMNMVGELVLVRNRLATLKSRLGDEEVANAVANLDVVTADLQNSVMKTRMQPIKKVFGRFPRVVRDLARSLNKEINLEMTGEETDLDKNLVEALSDPMVHLVRNAVDHGIETPDEREKAGKPRQGTVLLSAAQEGDHILLSISDDGKGMDADALRRKAVERGMMDQEAAARLDEKECFHLIFQPGFSTKSEISDVSGRGVGMDVVKTRISQMNGSVDIDSELGKGSVITIKLPLTLAILPTLMVVLGVQSFALPLSSVVEIFNLDLQRTHMVDGQLTIMVRERALPLFYLRNWLISSQSGSDQQNHGHVVVVNVGGKQVCLVVDYLIGQEEVVIKPLGSMLQGLEGMAGATITGDGKIALILDIPGLMRKYASRY
ncbi:MAG: chemotaxis protein CheA [Gammaproteobacteria bacterium]|nr:chemotaxis protein CheA [Gammaproteobacteria bacterium]